jgi:hypothetical protein
MYFEVTRNQAEFELAQEDINISNEHTKSSLATALLITW